ncbi:MAG: DUF4350 domain-containing protein, partial [Myxococcota bacterium]
VARAGEQGVRLDTPAEIEVASLDRSDGLLLLHPVRGLPLASLAAFLRSGGRVALADDFGEGEALLSLYGIRRERAEGEGIARLRGNPRLLVATASSRHPLAEGVSSLVTNHPAELRHPALDPVFAFGDGALVLTGAVEQGRLVALSDPSVLINNMQRFKGNARFAANLLAYLGEGGGRVLIATPTTRVRGRFGERGVPPLDQLRDALGELAGAEAPPLALRLFALVLFALCLVVAVSSLSLTTPYDGAAMRTPRGKGGGFGGRLAFFARRREHLAHPALRYGVELERSLGEALGLGAAPARGALFTALEDRLDPGDRAALGRALAFVDTLRRGLNAPGGPPRVSGRELRRLRDAGEAARRGVRARRD